jgi:hypothetical protein|tara:strand:- start:5577 stop:6128 length:552 start_codon:yes stop_codon:yes gene_type:complete
MRIKRLSAMLLGTLTILAFLFSPGWAVSFFGGGGKVVQMVNTQTGAVATGTTNIPFDDTIPQITEGDEYMTLAITPTNASNTLIIEVIANVGSALERGQSVALFQDSTANALASVITHTRNSADVTFNVALRHKMTAGTTSSTTFRVRAGASSGSNTITFNGSAAGRLGGGVIVSSITIWEVE